jgi:bacteriocin biosynthesis cyclodehydratase domain-containing protein
VLAEGDRLLLEYGERVVVFEGQAVNAILVPLLALLDGSRSRSEIEGYFGEDVRSVVGQALAVLHEHGVLAEGPGLDSALPPTVRDALCWLTSETPGMSVAQCVERLRGNSVAIVGGSRIAMEVRRLLYLCGVPCASSASWEIASEPSEPTGLYIVAPMSKELPQLERWNSYALERKQVWLQVLPFNGLFATVGPLYVPAETCCYRCFQIRRWANSAYPEYLLSLEKQPAPFPSPPAVESIVAGLATSLALRWMTRLDPFIPGQFYAVEMTLEMELTRHTIYRVPRCDVCSKAQQASPPALWYEELRG